jgi:opacity protein-like surface antigen
MHSQSEFPLIGRIGYFPIAVVIAALLGAAPAAAQQADGPYVGLRALAGLSDGGDLSLSTGRSLDLDDDAMEWSVGSSVVAGWRFEDLPVRAEIEYIWRYRFDIDAHTTTAPTQRVKSNIDTHSLYLNAYLDIPVSLSFRGYVGAGIGVARHNAQTRFIGAGSVTENEDADTQMTWMATAGVQYDLSESWLVDASYRYTDLGEITTPTSPIGALEADNYVSHDFLVGVAYQF